MSGATPANPPHVERLAQHTQSPSARWHKYLAGIAEATRHTADQREARNRERTDGTDYSRRARGESTTGE